MNQKQSWEEEFEKDPFLQEKPLPDYILCRKGYLLDFIRKTVQQAIKTREREISEEVEKIDGQDRLYEGREFVDVDVVLSIVGGKKYEDLC